jgi:hypothetical protein
VFIAAFSNISAISWRTVLVVEEAGVPGENTIYDHGHDGPLTGFRVVIISDKPNLK